LSAIKKVASCLGASLCRSGDMAI